MKKNLKSTLKIFSIHFHEILVLKQQESNKQNIKDYRIPNVNCKTDNKIEKEQREEEEGE